MFGMVTAIVVQPNPDFDPEEVPIAPSNWRKDTDGVSTVLSAGAMNHDNHGS